MYPKIKHLSTNLRGTVKLEPFTKFNSKQILRKHVNSLIVSSHWKYFFQERNGNTGIPDNKFRILEEVCRDYDAIQIILKKIKVILFVLNTDKNKMI